jgi:hypothetical protein
MTSLRKTALAAGIFYLLSFVSIPTLALYEPIRDANYVVGPGSGTGVIFGVVLEIVVALAGIGTAVARTTGGSHPGGRSRRSSVAIASAWSGLFISLLLGPATTLVNIN